MDWQLDADIVSVEHIIWMIVGFSIVVVIAILWRNRATPVEYEPKRDETLQKLFEELS